MQLYEVASSRVTLPTCRVLTIIELVERLIFCGAGCWIVDNPLPVAVGATFPPADTMRPSPPVPPPAPAPAPPVGGAKATSPAPPPRPLSLASVLFGDTLSCAAACRSASSSALVKIAVSAGLKSLNSLSMSPVLVWTEFEIAVVSCPGSLMPSPLGRYSRLVINNLPLIVRLCQARGSDAETNP